MTSGQLLLACAVVTVGSLVQGTIGFGNALVSAPLLLLIQPSLVPGPFTIAGIALNLLMLSGDRGSADPRIRWAAVGLVPGTVVAGVALAIMSDHALAVTASSFVLVAVLLSAGGLTIVPGPGSLLVTGAVSGFMGTVSSVGGPPVALLYQRAGGPRLRATLARFFVVSSSLALVAIVAAGRLDGDQLRAGIAMLPGALAGWLVARRLVGRVDRLTMRPVVLSVSAISAALVLVRELS